MNFENSLLSKNATAASEKILIQVFNYFSMEFIQIITERYALSETTPYTYAFITSALIYALVEMTKNARDGSRAMSWG